MKARREQVDEKITVIKLFAINYARDLISMRSTQIQEYGIDETIIKVVSEYIWLWVAIKQKDNENLEISISKERNIFVAERFLSHIMEKYGSHPISTDGGTWYPQACKFLILEHHIHSAFEKSVIERTMQYLKDRTKVLMIIFLVIEKITNLTQHL